MSAIEPPGIEGVVLPVYAAVSAANAEGFPLDDVLTLEGIPPQAWESADLAWKQHLVAEKAAFAQYEAELATAEDWLDRGVSPLGSDLGAWLAFLDAYAAHGAPFELLERLDLGLNDMSRLKRIWDRRIKEDASIEKRIAELRKKTLGPIPPLTVKPRALKRRRGASSKDGAIGAKPVATEVSAAPQRTMSTGDLGLDLYATICAHHETRPKDLEQLRRFGITSEEQRVAMDARWQKEFTRDPTLQRDFRLLVAHEKRRISARDKNPAPAAPAASRPREIAPAPVSVASPIVALPSKHLQGTSLALDVPRGPALPFAKGAPVVITSLPEVTPKQSPASSLAGTAMALDVPRGGALPFAAAPADAAKPGGNEGKSDVASRRPVGPGSGTAFALEVPRGPATPFARPTDRPSTPSGSAATPPQAKSVAARLGATAAAVEVPRGPELPFQNAVRPKKSKLGDLASFELPKELRAAMGGAPPAEAKQSPPAPQPPPPPHASPILTLEQHASLTLELALSPHKTEEILARYRLTQEGREALDRHYRARIAEDPKLSEAWQRAYAGYHEWLTKGSR